MSLELQTRQFQIPIGSRDLVARSLYSTKYTDEILSWLVDRKCHASLDCIVSDDNLSCHVRVFFYDETDPNILAFKLTWT